MKLSRLIPIASLAIVMGVALSALVFDAPTDFPFTEPPVGAAPKRPDLGLGSTTLHGRVVDGSGAPIENAGVTIRSGTRPAFARSNASGDFELEGLLDGGGRLLVVALGFEATRFDLDAWPATEPGARHVIALEREISEPPNPEGLTLLDLEGRVEFGPMAAAGDGYEVFFRPVGSPSDPSGGFPRRVAVEADGSFAVPGLHVGPYRVIRLGPDDRGGEQPDLLRAADGAVRTFVHGEGDGTPPLDLVSTAGGIEGTVLQSPESEDGPRERNPVRGALVRIEPLVASDSSPDELTVDPTHFRASRTDSEGRFQARDLPPGPYRVSVFAGKERAEATVVVETRTVGSTEVVLD